MAAPCSGTDPHCLYQHRDTIETGLKSTERAGPWNDGNLLYATPTDVVFAEELHAHDGEDEDDDAQDERQVTQGAHRFSHNGDEQVERRPRFRQFEHSQLSGRTGWDGTDGKEDCQCNCVATDERRLLYDEEITNRNERRTDKPETPSRPSSRSDRKTMMKSKMFQPSLK